MLTLTDNGTDATLAVANINATTGFFLNGTNINVGTTLSNVAYLDQANTFALGQTINTGGILINAGGENITGGINNNNGGITNSGAITQITYATASGSITGSILNGTTQIQLNGTNINTTGTLSNIAYKGQNNNFTTSQNIAGTLTLTGAATDITTGSNEDLTLLANGTGVINLNDTVKIPTLASPDGNTALCRNGSDLLSACAPNSNGVTLQLAYDAGNTILTSSGRDISFTLYDENTDSGTPTSFTLMNAGTAPAFIVNDVNANSNGIAFEIQSASSSALTISELGTINTSGNIVTTGTGTITSAGALTVNSGGASVTGGINNNRGGIS